MPRKKTLPEALMNLELVRLISRLPELLAADQWEHSGSDVLNISSSWSDFTLEKEAIAVFIRNDGANDLLATFSEAEKTRPFVLEPGDEMGLTRKVQTIHLRARAAETTKARWVALSIRRPI